MKARNSDQNTVYFPKVDSERIEKKIAVLLRPEIHFLILKDWGFFCEGGKLCCNDKIRQFISFLFFFYAETLYRKRKSNSK